MKKLFEYWSTLLLIFGVVTLIQAQNVSGTILDEDGDPLIGATVTVEGTTAGTISDVDGSFTITANQGDILLISYVGYTSQSVAVDGSILNIILEEDFNILNDVVVSATRRPVRKIQATTAINSIGERELTTLQSESFTEAIQNVPGITVDGTQGRKGGFNIRGFPGGNTTTTLIDGLPVSGIANLAGGTQEFFSIDPSVERIEVVRGAAATLFGRSAAAGAINIISKTGGSKTQGSISLTRYNNVAGEGHQFDGDFDYRADWNVNGPLADKWRYNIGGYFINDSGNKEQYAKDRGTQIRTNLDWLISKKSNIRISAGFFNNEFQNVTDQAWDLANNQPAPGWGGENTFHNDASVLGVLGVRNAFFNPSPAINQQTGSQIMVDFGSNTVESAVGGSAGIDATLDLGSNWSWNGKIKYTKTDWRDVNEVGLDDFFTTESNILRINATAYNEVQSTILETRLSKLIEGNAATHSITGGLYYSKGNRDRLGLNYFYRSSVSIRPEFSTAFGFGNGSFSNPALPQTAYVSGTSSHREEKSTAIFIGDEMVFNDKLSINAGFRYDWLNTIFNNDPKTLSNLNVDYDPGQFLENDLTFKDFSWSVGANYLIGESSAIYANYVRAFILPTIDIASELPENNEIAKNFEIGYRAGLGELSADITFFNTDIDNSVITTFNASTAEFINVPGGSYQLRGGELSLVYTPKAIKGLLLRGGVTLQDSKYDFFTVRASNADTDGNLFGLTLRDGLFDVTGHSVQDIHKTLLNATIGYNKSNWGFDVAALSYSGAKADVLNLYDLPNITIVNLGAYVNLLPKKSNQLKLGLRIKNLLDAENARNLFAGSDTDSSLQEMQDNPSANGRLAWAILQNPRRMLLTLSYNF